MRICLENIDCSNAVRTKESECQESESKEKPSPVVFRRVLTSDTKQYTADHRGDHWKNQVDQLVLRLASTSFLSHLVGHPVTTSTSDNADEDSCN